MLKIKIVNTEDMYFEDEEAVINQALREIQQHDTLIINITYRQNSTIIEYHDYEEHKEQHNTRECNTYDNTKDTYELGENTLLCMNESNIVKEDTNVKDMKIEYSLN